MLKRTSIRVDHITTVSGHPGAANFRKTMRRFEAPSQVIKNLLKTRSMEHAVTEGRKCRNNAQLKLESEVSASG